MSALELNLPALIVVGPLLAALVVALVGQRGRAWPLTVATTTALFGLTLWLASKVLVAPEGRISFDIGGWSPVPLEGVAGLVPIGIEYRVDGLNALVLVLVAGVAAVVTPFARLSVAREVPEDRLHFFYAAYLLCLTGMLGITITGDAFNVYVLLEITSLTSYALIAMGKGRDRRALTASFHYLLMGTVGASFLLVGIGYLIMVTGTLNMADMAQQLQALGPNRTVIAAFAMILVGVTIKMGLFPLHQWLPGAYTYAPSAVTALLASTATKVGIYVALRFFFTIFGAAFALESFAGEAMTVLACLAILHGSLMAIQQTDVKRLLAFSSVAQIGYMALGLGLHTETGLTGALLHMLNHALVKGALFVAIGAVIYRAGAGRLEDLRGLAKKMPLTAAAIVVACLGLVGIPLTGGFLSKWYLVSAAVSTGHWGVAVAVLVGSLLAVVYCLRLIEPMLFGREDEGPQVGEAPPSMLLPAWLLAAGSVVLGCTGGGEPVRRLLEAAVGAIAGGQG